MSVELWIGEEVEHHYESKASATLLRNRSESPTRFYVLASFRVNNGLIIINYRK